MAFNTTGALSGAASGAAAGTAISPGYGTAAGALLGGALGGFLDTEPKTDFWDNYYAELSRLRGSYKREARYEVEGAARKAQAAQSRSGLSGNVATGIVRAQLPRAMSAAEIAAQRGALAAASEGSMITQNDYSELWKGLQGIGYYYGQKDKPPQTNPQMGTPTNPVVMATGGVAPSASSLNYPGNANYPAAPTGYENYGGPLQPNMYDPYGWFANNPYAQR